MTNDTKEPTHCDTCKASLERGYSFRYKGDALVSALCFDCDRAERLKAWRETGHITNAMIIDAIIRHEPKELADLHEYLQAATKRFERDVWFKGVQPIMRDAKYRGHRADCEGMTILGYSMCGRAMITIERGEATISAICAEDSATSTMGYQGACGKAGALIDLLDDVRRAYVAGKWQLRRDDGVSVLGVGSKAQPESDDKGADQ